MDDDIAPRRTISLIRYEDDHALVARGSLIPLALKKHLPLVPLVPKDRSRLLPVLIMLTLLLVGGYAVAKSPLADTLVSTVENVATPAILMKNSASEWESPVTFGAAEAYAKDDFYRATEASLIAGGATFIDLDLTENQLRYFKRGVLMVSGEVGRAPDGQSWCKTVSGFYQVEDMSATHRSSFVGATLPHTIKFGPNLFIHGNPEYEPGLPVPADFDRDCVRLDTDTASKLFSLVTVGTAVLVHAPKPREQRELFSFESKVPLFSTPHYLIADIGSETILAVGDRYDAVPMASLAKLMTTLVVLERMSLDDELSVSEPSLVASVIPRLLGRSSVSLATLLELLLVESSNEAAEVIAEAYGREALIKAMNAKANKLGLADTVFTDPSGVDSGNVSSVNDLWWLTRYIYLYQPIIFKITRSEATPVPGVTDTIADLVNFNKVEAIDSFVGGKVGETEAAKQTSISLHRVMIADEERIIAVILLGSDSRRTDVLRLLDYVHARFSP